MTSIQRHANEAVIAKIEKVFEDIADNLLLGVKLSIPLKYKKSASSQSDAELSTEVTHISFPARTPQEARQFTVLLRILELIHEALCNDEIVSKRNIYYKDPALFKSQNVVDRYVDIFAYTFGIRRAALNVTAAAKGLVVGDYTITHTDGSVTHHDPDITHLVNDGSNVESVDASRVSWILVIEKESTFRTSASSSLHQSSRAGKGIVLTAKGYPDLSTRAFLHLLATPQDSNHAVPPIYALADFDPDGVAIISTYKHGSGTLSHENGHLIVPSIQWLGIQSGDITNSRAGEEFKGLLRLSGRDRHKARKMLENNAVLKEGGIEPEWRRELQIMLMLNVKAEMEVLAEREGGVTRWVEEKLLEYGKASSRVPVDDDDATTSGSEDDDDLDRR